MTASRTIAEAFPPGQFLDEELAARGWTTRELAERMGGDIGMNQLCVEMLISVREKGLLVGEDTARQLGLAFGVSPQYWLNLDAAWQSAP